MARCSQSGNSARGRRRDPSSALRAAATICSFSSGLRSCRSSRRSAPPGRSARAAGGRIPAWTRGQLRHGLGRDAPAQVGPAASVPRPRARRVDEHAVEPRRAGARTAGVRHLDPDDGRPACARPVAASAAARPGWRSTATTSPSPPSARRGASSSRPGRRRGRARARPAGGRPARATSIDARDCGITAPAARRLGAVDVEGAARARAPPGGRALRARRPRARRAARRPRAGGDERVDAHGGLRGLVDRRQQRARLLGARARPTTGGRSRPGPSA